jgi:hypothetical protein
VSVSTICRKLPNSTVQGFSLLLTICNRSRNITLLWKPVAYWLVSNRPPLGHVAESVLSKPVNPLFPHRIKLRSILVRVILPCTLRRTNSLIEPSHQNFVRISLPCHAWYCTYRVCSMLTGVGKWFSNWVPRNPGVQRIRLRRSEKY